MRPTRFHLSLIAALIATLSVVLPHYDLNSNDCYDEEKEELCVHDADDDLEDLAEDFEIDLYEEFYDSNTRDFERGSFKDVDDISERHE